MQYQGEVTEDHWWIIYGANNVVVAAAQLLDAQDADFQRISAKFAAHKCFQVNKVWRVENPTATARYELRRKAMANPTETTELYHTTKAPLATIVAEGLDIRKSTKGLLGAGLYATPDIIKASTYWGLLFNYRIMLEVAMLTGTPHCLPPGVLDFALPATLPLGCDSVVGRVKAGIPETAVYSNDQVLVKFIIDYEINPDYDCLAKAHLHVT
jgi:hypothetical protein